MIKTLLVATLLIATCTQLAAQITATQTRTADNLNNLNNFRDVFGDLNYPIAVARDVSVDDDVFASTAQLLAIKDSSSSFTSSSVSTLALQSFRFNIPGDATIKSISIRLSRFRTGTAPVGDLQLSLMQRMDCDAGTCVYGKFWTYLDKYNGQVYPLTETQYTFTQSGRGIDGGFNHNESYQWTPSMINHQFFGVLIDSYPPVGEGSLVIKYDFVEVAVNYTLPASSLIVAQFRIAKKPWKPVIYPNPFIKSTRVQFTAAETGNAVVDIYNIAGVKISNIFSAKVEQGQSYNVSAGGPFMAKGTYMLRIQNGKYSYTARLIKLD
jgi:hypothetical protein